MKYTSLSSSVHSLSVQFVLALGCRLFFTTTVVKKNQILFFVASL